MSILSVFLAGALRQNHYDMCILFQWFCGFLIVASYACHWLYSRSGILPAITALYLSFNAIYTFALLRNRYENLELHAACATDALYSILSLWAVIFLASLVDKKKELALREYLPWFGIINSIFVVAGILTAFEGGGFGRLPAWAGFIDYPGMNATLICLSVPFILDNSKLRLWAIPLVVLAIVASQSSVPYGVFSVVVAAYYFSKLRLRVWIPALIPLVPLTIGLLVEKGNLFNSAKRFEAYKVFMTSWYDNANHWVGTGPGTFVTFDEIIQKNTGFMISKTHSFYWPTLHSDLLQSVFETGYIGIILILLLFLDAARRLYKREGGHTYFAMLLGIFSAAIFDFPVRYFLMSFLTVYSLSLAYEPRA